MIIRRLAVRQHVARFRQCGLTLIEIMVAMTIGLLLLVALETLLVRSIGVFSVSDNSARMQENAVFAMNSIGSDLRMAGFYGRYALTFPATPPTGAARTITDPTPLTVTNDCGANWAITAEQPIFGFNGLSSAAANAALPCITTGNFIASAAGLPSFILVVRGATGVQVPPASLDAATVYVQSDVNSGIIFKGSDYAGLAASAKKLDNINGIPVAAPIYPYQSRAYYLRPCSRPTGTNNTICQAGDDDGRPIPTLVRQELVGTSIVENAVAEGIESMRIFYGVDTSGSGSPGKYIETPAANEFAQVVAVRISLLVRAPKPATGYDDSSRSYDLTGDGTADVNCVADLLPCNYHRHVFTQSFQVRNIAQRR